MPYCTPSPTAPPAGRTAPLRTPSACDHCESVLSPAAYFVDLMYWLLESEPVSVSAYCLPTGERDPIGRVDPEFVDAFEIGAKNIWAMKKKPTRSPTSSAT